MSASPAKAWRRGRPMLLAMLLPLLAACSGGFDGQYAQVNERTGEIRRNQDGTPKVVLTVDGEAASVFARGFNGTFRTSVIDDKLHLIPVSGDLPGVVLRKEGDQLVTEGMGEDRFVRL